MRRFSTLFFGFVFALVGSEAAQSQIEPCASKGPAFVAGNTMCLVAHSQGSTTSPQGTLIVILHGDVSAGGPANYHFNLGRDIARAYPRAAIFGIVRPGYPNGGGLVSDGSDNGRRDHYTAENIDAVAAAIVI